MENISPTWCTLSRIKYKIVSGNAVRTAVFESCRGQESALDQYLLGWAHQLPCPPPPQSTLTSYQKALVELLDQGFRGKPIYQALVDLEADVREALDAEIQEHVAQLPYLSLFPMMFMIGPAFFILLLGPVLWSLVLELGQ